MQFFDAYGLPTEGLTRGEIKAVYRDITTKSFTFSKTAEVIENSLTTDQLGGYEIWQENPTPEDIENLWNYKNITGSILSPKQEGIQYKYHSDQKMDSILGFDIHDKSYLEQYDGESLVWSVPFSEFRIDGYRVISNGVIAYGQTDRWSSKQDSYAWLAKVDTNGNLLWKQMLSSEFHIEYIAEVLENADGSYAVFSRGDLRYFCLSQYTADGTKTHFLITPPPPVPLPSVEQASYTSTHLTLPAS